MAEGKIAGLYDLERTLGKGHFAVVKLARHVFTGQRVAVKVIDKSKLAGEAAGQLLQEVRCMKLVQHPNVVRLYEVIDTHAKLYLILELGDGGDMFDHIMRHEGGLAEPRAKHYFAQIVHAISYCHKLHVVHRDLKPENVVFFQEQGVVKLTDFGFSNRFQPGKMLTTSCGSLAYSAPEILLGDEYDAPAVGKGLEGSHASRAPIYCHLSMHVGLCFSFLWLFRHPQSPVGQILPQGCSAEHIMALAAMGCGKETCLGCSRLQLPKFPPGASCRCFGPWEEKEDWESSQPC